MINDFPPSLSDTESDLTPSERWIFIGLLRSKGKWFEHRAVRDRFELGGYGNVKTHLSRLCKKLEGSKYRIEKRGNGRLLRLVDRE